MTLLNTTGSTSTTNENPEGKNVLSLSRALQLPTPLPSSLYVGLLTRSMYKDVGKHYCLSLSRGRLYHFRGGMRRWLSMWVEMML
jgi:hypothetical protein